mgnify:CR=1 FL=1
MAAISTDVNQPVCAYIDRRGHVIRVGVGSPRQTQIPAVELPRYGAERLSGIRCIATQLKQEKPGNAAQTAMALQRLDALVVLTLTGGGFQRKGGGATGYIRDVYLAHLVPDETQRWLVSEPIDVDTLSQEDFADLTEGLEEEFRRLFIAQQVDASHDRVLLVGLKTDKMASDQFRNGLQELSRLVETAGGEVLETLQQKRSKPHPQTVLGAGKIEEVALEAQTLGVSLVVFDRDLSPAQVRSLEQRIGVRVVDRTELN